MEKHNSQHSDFTYVCLLYLMRELNPSKCLMETCLGNCSTRVWYIYTDCMYCECTSSLSSQSIKSIKFDVHVFHVTT